MLRDRCVDKVGERDHHYAFVNFSSMLAATQVAFNSRFHSEAWFEALPRFLRHFPEYNLLDSVDKVRQKKLHPTGRH